MSKVTDRLFCEKGDKENFYDKISESEAFFKGKDRRDQFLYAMAVGVRNRMKQPLSRTDGMFNTRDLSGEDEALLYAVAILDTGSFDILNDIASVYRIAEEYAHAGVQIIAKELETVQYGSYSKQLELGSIEIYEQISTGK